MRNPWQEFEAIRRSAETEVKKHSSARRDEFALRTMTAFARYVSLASDPQVKLDFISKVVGLADTLMMTLDGDERVNYTPTKAQKPCGCKTSGCTGCGEFP